jgi:hypothetical protein
MLKGRRKLSSKLEKNQLFLPGFPATSLLFPFSLRRGLQPPPLISPPSFPRNTTSHPSPSNLTTVTVPLSLPLFSAKLFSSPPPQLQQQQRRQPPFPAASTPTRSSQSSISFLSHTNSSSCELSFSSAGICSFFFQP